MASASSPSRGILSAAIIGALFIAFACGCQAAFAPTVTVSCPARTSGAPDCDLRWLVAFDQIQVRHTPLPGLQSVGDIGNTAPGGRRGGGITLYLITSAGPVRTIQWGDHLSLQRDLWEPLRAYLADPQAPAIELTMWPSRWVDPGGMADNRVLRKAHPIRLAANALVVVGLLYWISVPVRIVQLVARRRRS